MLLTENDHVIQALSTQCTDHSLHIGILPGRAGRNELLVHLEARNAPPEFSAIDTIAIPQKNFWCPLERECLHNLLPRPKRRGRFGDCDVDDLPPLVQQNDEDEKHAEGRGRNGEEIDRSDLAGVVAKKGGPTLPRRPWTPRPIAPDRGIRNAHPKFRQFVPNPRTTPG